MTEHATDLTAESTTAKAGPAPDAPDAPAASQTQPAGKRAGCVCDCRTCPCNPKAKLKKPPQNDQNTKA